MAQVLSAARAQEWEIGANAAATGFMGDINTSNPFYFKSAGGGLNLTRNFNPTWGLQASYQFLHVRAFDSDSNDPYQRARGDGFENRINELSVRGNFNFFKFIAGRASNRYSPYLFAGFAAFIHRPQQSGARAFALAIPFGAGFKYNIKGPWSIGTEAAYRTAFTDDIDSITDGNAKPNDSYMTAGLTLTYTFISKRCYWWN